MTRQYAIFGEGEVYTFVGPYMVPFTARTRIADIQQAVAAYYGFPASEMKSGRRARMIARPRQVAMYLSKQLTPRSLPEIGRMFGGRDHTTIIHGVRQIERLRTFDRELDSDVRTLARLLSR